MIRIECSGNENKTNYLINSFLFNDKFDKHNKIGTELLKQWHPQRVQFDFHTGSLQFAARI